jgi:hypothetical protein
MKNKIPAPDFSGRRNDKRNKILAPDFSGRRNDRRNKIPVVTMVIQRQKGRETTLVPEDYSQFVIRSTLPVRLSGRLINMAQS